jgi:NADPH-dependent 2,4-dienoyl-CoA reductase/sulfur reductase-like enzyme
MIATGAVPIIPDMAGIALPGVMTLKSLEHGRRIKDFIISSKVQRMVIIGMGYIALEMCEALRSRNIQVDMVKPGPVFLPWMAPELSNLVQNELRHNNISLYTGQEIKEIRRKQNILSVICSDTTLECQMVLVAMGVTPDNKLAVEAGLDLGPSGAISVDRTLKTSDEDIYAAGDCADAYHVVTGKKVFIPLALRANRAGWAVADNIAGAGTELEGIAGTSVFKVFDLQVARTGLTNKEAEKHGFEPVEDVITSNSRAHSHSGGSKISVYILGDRKSGRLLGMQMVGKEGAAHRINAAAVALHQKMTVQAFSQCDMAYAPPFSPVWDPMLTAANQLLKKL